MRPRVVVLPGMDGNALMLDGFAAALGSAEDPGRVVQVQYPGDSHLHPIDAVGAYIVREYLAKLQSDTRGYIIVAQSYSGHVALSLCSGRWGTIPGNCVGCVLVNAFCSPPVPAALRYLSSLVPSFAFSQRLPLSAISYFLLGSGRLKEARQVQDAVSRCDPAVMLARMRDCLHDDSWSEWRDRLSLIGSSVLYLRGSSDPLVGKTDLVRRMKEARDDISFVDVHAGPHLLLQCAPDVCARTIDDYYPILNSGDLDVSDLRQIGLSPRIL
jgi:hypothetical protein